MSEVNFTPGPWRSSWGQYLPIIATVEGKEAQIGRAESFGHISDEECEANARLIAAAPDLYEACKDTLARMECLCEMWGPEAITRRVTEQLRAALAKVEARNEQ